MGWELGAGSWELGAGSWELDGWSARGAAWPVGRFPGWLVGSVGGASVGRCFAGEAPRCGGASVRRPFGGSALRRAAVGSVSAAGGPPEPAVR
ncbi:hypothetical protein EJ357_06410 [Streptomyces cyaneochromogenes]|uniref:Uncharacterized protein n=1 Tax=Streptomyces cyaneochromogenes TaxID=2496836 RepID=A0A3Q9ELK0_9ACTN|nr:hypothetical protein EJ357_06410 [Streptomyces cyaneochromogenes]